VKRTSGPAGKQRDEAALFGVRARGRDAPDRIEARALGTTLCIDAGVGHIRLRACGGRGEVVFDETIPSGGDLSNYLSAWGLTGEFGARTGMPVFVTGKLADLASDTLGCGSLVQPAAAAWLAARDLMRREEGRDAVRSLAIVELSASGYQVVGVDREGRLKDDLLLVNSRCGAGSGVNLDRVLQKLGLARDDVDRILAAYAGDAGRELREQATVRADRCGVFASSATISDKNQGIPLDVALATTLKSEVLKACRRLPPGFDKVCLAGRVFRWRFARECAEDYLAGIGVREIVCDPDNTQMLDSLRGFVADIGADRIVSPDRRLLRAPVVEAYPALAALKESLSAAHRYLRLADTAIPAGALGVERPVHLALDVGSTMAKAVVADAASGEILWLRAYSNSGDTIQTIQQVFRDMAREGVATLPLRGVGITGSARFQVRQALEHIYPELAGRVVVLVENYAHARGSIAFAREHVARLKAAGVTRVNEDFCVLVDIGGEDTKISSIALGEAELFGNAMNLKCSAGTGSLMDTLSALFGLSNAGDVGAACAEAFAAPRGHAINATCAVFLMENARKLQLRGVPRGEILASANWAIVENMARTLWNQLELPRHAVVLLHGQTMLSEPLPLAVAHRLQSWLDAPAYTLVPPNPGHRACVGLIHTLRQTAPAGSAALPLARFIDATFEKRIVQCHGAACDDQAACCNRSRLTCRGSDGRKLVSFTVGGCSAINELLAKKKDQSPPAAVRDSYKELWDFVDARHPASEDPERLVIPRSFVVSEWAGLFAGLFGRLGLPVHVDKVRDTDLALAQPLFNIDTCAPHMGAVGQYRRLAGAAHGIVLAPQIEFLPTGGASAGRTCTLNQGGVAVAMNLARLAHPEARFHLFNLDLSVLDADAIHAQLRDRLAPVFGHYGIAPTDAELRAAIAGAIGDQRALRRAAADLAATLAEEALAQGIPIGLVVGREYILNPGIYDSHVRRLLRDKHLLVLPSWVLDLELNPDYGHIYWRNPHFMVSLLDAVARRKLHERLRHPRLASVFRRIESGDALLPVVQVSTFSCGPDSVVQPFIAEIMKRRPFLLIQSDAVIKELAHLENRVNTYVKQLELGLHERLHAGSASSFQIRSLDELTDSAPIDRATDAIYFPTISDNRTVTAVLRGAGYTCIDNYGEDYDLQRLVRQGRKAAGDSVCAPLAAVYADLERAVDDFTRRRQAGDPLVAGKTRLLYFDNKGPGPCRQGQYVDVHRLLFHRHAAGGSRSCEALPGHAVVKFLVGNEAKAFDIGIEEWVLARAHQGTILQGVLHALLFEGGAACRDFAEYERFSADYRALKAELYGVLENRPAPGRLARGLLRLSGGRDILGLPIKYFAYGLTGRDLARPLSRFARRWIHRREANDGRVRIALAGEVYMRVSQAEEVFRSLLANLGFRRFRLEYAPVWSYIEFMADDWVEVNLDRIDRAVNRAADAAQRARLAGERRGVTRRAGMLKFLLRRLVAGPLYRAARLPMPAPTAEVIRATRELLPTLRPLSEIVAYVGEALTELRSGVDLFLNVGPGGCMVASMGEALTPAIVHAAGRGRIQHLFSAEGDLDEELLKLSLLRALGPERYYGAEKQ